ncbi:MAG: hypothetical protein IPH06_04375 [Alphaproteobacteria bacterium]|nr:hypothetical protein [Alphaproteobacteria bacterium]
MRTTGAVRTRRQRTRSPCEGGTGNTGPRTLDPGEWSGRAVAPTPRTATTGSLKENRRKGDGRKLRRTIRTADANKTGSEQHEHVRQLGPAGREKVTER